MKLATQIILAFSVVILTSIMDSIANYLLSIKVKQNSEFLAKSETIIRNSNKLHNAVIDMQSAFRGYLLTDDTTFIILYNGGLENIPPLFAEQKTLITGKKEQAAMLDSIYQWHNQWLTYSRSLIKAKQELSFSEAQKAVYTDLFENKLRKQVGKKLNDAITAKFIEFDKYEYRIRNLHDETLIASIRRTNTLSFIFLGLTIVTGLSSAIYIVVVITRRIKSMVGLAENISKGEFTVVEDNRNDELTGLSRSLNVMSDKLSKNIHELQSRNAELNKFAYVVSHDLKAPIRGIYNVTQWIEEDLGHELSPEMKKYLRIIPQRTQRMEDLINGLLEYARISEKTHNALIDTNVLVQEITDAVVPRTFKVELQNLPVVYSEQLKLEQVFTNLISNAVKYTPHANGHIVISCREFPDFYRFSVKDNGIGIDPEYHEKIFEIFQTLREKNEKESTGIGLAIVKKIMDEQHGTIKVNSKAGEGAEFIFTWPRNKNVST